MGVDRLDYTHFAIRLARTLVILAGMLNTSQIIEQLRQQLSRLNAAIRALENSGRSAKRPTHSGAVRSGRQTRKDRRMSASARRRISAGMKARWAEAKKAGKRSL
jgi:hypothetical protein